MNKLLAFSLFAAQLWLWLTLLNRRSERKILLWYMPLIAWPYLLRVSLFPSIPAWPAWVIAAGHILVALETCFDGLPYGSERRWLLATSGVFGSGMAGMVLIGDSGTITRYLSDYYVLTGACMLATAMGSFTGAYLGRYWTWRQALPVWALVAYFSVDVAVNALYRYTEWVRDFNRMLVAVDHGWHLAVVGVILWRMNR
jgi:hypothetical protein